VFICAHGFPTGLVGWVLEGSLGVASMGYSPLVGSLLRVGFPLQGVCLG
jgi:hypothetical protein